MNSVLNPFKTSWNSLACIGGLLGYVLRFVRAYDPSIQPRPKRVISKHLGGVSEEAARHARKPDGWQNVA